MAYFDLAQKYHPDKNQNKDNREEIFKNYMQIKAAYELLIDENIRVRYVKDY